MAAASARVTSALMALVLLFAVAVPTTLAQPATTPPEAPAGEIQNAQPAAGPSTPNPSLPAPEDTETQIGTEAETLAPFALLDPGPRPPRSVRLSLATWNVTDDVRRAAGAGASSPEPDPQPSVTWRHTFGAERRTAPVVLQAAAHADADIVALQGVTNLSIIHHAFNANRYRVIASRQLWTSVTTSTIGIAVQRSDAPATTAVIYRHRAGGRGVGGVRHFQPARSADRTEQPPAITAFRLRVYTDALWFASLDLPVDCASDMAGETCGRHAVTLNRFLYWAERTARRKVPLVLLGRWPRFVAERLSAAGFDIAASVAAHGACGGASPATRSGETGERGVAADAPGPAKGLPQAPVHGPAILLAAASNGRSRAELTATAAGTGEACVATADLDVHIPPRRVTPPIARSAQ